MKMASAHPLIFKIVYTIFRAYIKDVRNKLNKHLNNLQTSLVVEVPFGFLCSRSCSSTFLIFINKTIQAGHINSNDDEMRKNTRHQYESKTRKSIPNPNAEVLEMLKVRFYYLYLHFILLGLYILQWLNRKKFSSPNQKKSYRCLKRTHVMPSFSFHLRSRHRV